MIRNPFHKLDQRKLRRSSDVLKTHNDYYKIVNQRVFYLCLIIVAIFGVICLRLFYLQIKEQDSYAIKLESYSSKKQSSSTPRGEIFDRNNKVVAQTLTSHDITYFPVKDVTSAQQWELAKRFSIQFEIDSSSLNTSDKQDLYMFLYRDEAGVQDNGTHLLDEKEKSLTGAEQDTLIRSRISEELVNEVASEEDKRAFVVYLAMNKYPLMQTKVVLEDASNDKIAYLMEHKIEYPGFDVDFGSWKRTYPFEQTFKDVVGTITTNKQGVPSDERSYYEAQGYAISDRVGNSGLEKEYESYLSGIRRMSDIEYGEDGIAVLNQMTAGKKGYNMHLSIDMELQKAVDTVLYDTLEKAKSDPRRQHYKKNFVVLMNPNNGEIYAMSGMLRTDSGEIIPYASGAYLETYVVGSIVKGATSYMGLHEGVINANTIIRDEPMKIKGTQTKGSFLNYGDLNVVGALENSSNVFMFKLAIMLAEGQYVPDQPLNIPDLQNSIKLMRNYYSMFGLGVKTGIDVPNESLGVTGYANYPGSLLDYSIGQFDSYTPIQVAQYASTIANGGKKVKPRLMRMATEINNDYVVFENKSEIQSTLPLNGNEIEIVQEGFRKCVTSGKCGVGMNGPHNVSAKTGTSEVMVDGNWVTNASLIGYAPYDNPQVAFSCAAPESDTNDAANLAGNSCYIDIMPKVLDEYFARYKTN